MCRDQKERLYSSRYIKILVNSCVSCYLIHFTVNAIQFVSNCLPSLMKLKCKKSRPLLTYYRRVNSYLMSLKLKGNSYLMSLKLKGNSYVWRRWLLDLWLSCRVPQLSNLDGSHRILRWSALFRWVIWQLVIMWIQN
jgi:hypothetical protein